MEIRGKEITAELSPGSSAAGVYLAANDSLVFKTQVRDQAVNARRERARTVGGIKDNPNIARVRGFIPYTATDASGNEENRVAVGYEYIDGPLITAKSFAPADGDQAILALAKAVGTLHGNGLIHGGIAKHQVRVRPETGQVVLLDAGWVWNEPKNSKNPLVDISGLRNIASAIKLSLGVRKALAATRSDDINEVIRDIAKAIEETKVRVEDVRRGPEKTRTGAPIPIPTPSKAPEPETDDGEGQEPEPTSVKKMPEAPVVLGTPAAANETLTAGVTHTRAESGDHAEPESVPEPEPEPEVEYDDYEPEDKEGYQYIHLPEESPATAAAPEATDPPEDDTDVDSSAPRASTTSKKPRKPVARPVPARKGEPALTDAARTEQAPSTGTVEPADAGPTPKSATWSWLGVRRNQIIAGSAVAVLLLGGAGAFAASSIKGDEKNQQTGATPSTTHALPEGFAESSSWNVAIPDGAKVVSADAGIGIIKGQQLTIYSTADGKKIRDMDLGGNPEFLVGTTVGDQDALAWKVGSKVTAWTKTTGKSGDPVSTTVDDGTQFTNTGEHLMMRKDNDVSTLGPKGKVTYPKSSGTPLAVDENGTINVSFDDPVSITPSDGKGKASDVSLDAPHDDQKVQTWVAAGHGMAISVWAKDAESTDDSTKVTVAVHSLEDGKAKGTYDTTLGKAKDWNWMSGQGGRAGTFGPLVVNLADGTINDKAPESTTFKKVKGQLAITGDNPATVYPASGNPYKISRGSVLAVTSTYAIVQEGDTIKAYPSDLT